MICIAVTSCLVTINLNLNLSFNNSPLIEKNGPFWLIRTGNDYYYYNNTHTIICISLSMQLAIQLYKTTCCINVKRIYIMSHKILIFTLRFVAIEKTIDTFQTSFIIITILLTIPYSGKFPWDKIFTDGSKNENSGIKLSQMHAGHSLVTEQQYCLICR